MYSVLMTMRRWQINPRTWLTAYLQACAEHGNRPPADLDAFLPWTMDAARLAAMRATSGSSLPIGQPSGVDTS
jgi:transposase